MTELAFQSALQLAEQIRNRSISASEMLDYFLDRVERFNPDLNAIVVNDFDRAIETARQADRDLAAGKSWGLLHGLPMTL